MIDSISRGLFCTSYRTADGYKLFHWTAERDVYWGRKTGSSSEIYSYSLKQCFASVVFPVWRAPVRTMILPNFDPAFFWIYSVMALFFTLYNPIWRKMHHTCCILRHKSITTFIPLISQRNCTINIIYGVTFQICLNP